ncbi:MAG TPA: dihydroorotase [Candidatus Thermoplasmatota archaeon]|nr:dihydroorotase [Candidatus Thermoplasmatota archaeon]
MDLVLRGRILQADGTLARGAVAVKDGVISAVARNLTGRDIVDVGERVILPGATDPHVHFRDPGHPEKEDFASGTRAAAFGGVTCVLDMPNTAPPVLDGATLAAKLAKVRPRAHVDFGLFLGLGASGGLDGMPKATALKMYLGATTGDLLVRDEAVVRAGLAAAKAADKPAVVHGEDEGCRERHLAEVGGRTDWLAHEDSRPAECERDAILGVARANFGVGARVHIAHLSTEAGLGALAPGMTAEVTPHHLLLDRDDLAKGGVYKMNPPLRWPADRAALYEALGQGRVCLASDHAPHTLAEKRAGVWEAPSGVPGVETLLPLFLAEAAAGRLPLAAVVAAACEMPARLFGLPKGRLEPGFDADLVVVDLAKPRPIRGSELHSKCGWTPYEGREGVFPTHVFLRGERLVDDGDLVGAARGRFLLGTERAARNLPPG